MRMHRSLIVCGLAVFACAALSIALTVTPPIIAPVPIALSVGSAALVLFVLSAPSLRFKSVLRFDEIQNHLRLFRLMWERGRPGVPGGGYAAKLAIGLRPRLFHREREYGKAFLITILGLRVHYSRSYGGIYA
ncbi:hypothetical protein AMC81_CH01875 [Rhizobium phaseoli]|uniref:Uncharacterized protein n=2 Tax=Rhizobium phaseoli TaxID=396 RepID=A0ABM6C8W5_9HYPH|nr:hypothetical protein AMC81_CH01875 [Rhizobium phaseoli]ANL91163.1 hypothetical protein AMC80_CH01875 [Rhizobium phaseoli]